MKEETSSDTKENAKSKKIKKRRVVKVIGKEEALNHLEGKSAPSKSLLCLNEYETTLTRRRISSSEEQDLSLGMKLTIIRGRVIVQSVNALKNGYASPAQLTGRITVGDVLLSIQHISLRHLSVDSLVDALGPLSDESLASLSVRFAIGQGIPLMQQQKQAATGFQNGVAGLADEFNLFSFLPTASQKLSDVENQKESDFNRQEPSEKKHTETTAATKVTSVSSTKAPTVEYVKQAENNKLTTIAQQISSYHTFQEKLWPSVFYEDYNNILFLKPPSVSHFSFNLASSDELNQYNFTQSQKRKFCKRFLLGARNFVDSVEFQLLQQAKSNQHCITSASIASASQKFSIANNTTYTSATQKRLLIKWKIIQEEEDDSENSDTYSIQKDDQLSSCSDDSVSSFLQDEILIQSHQQPILFTDESLWKDRLIEFLNAQKEEVGLQKEIALPNVEKNKDTALESLLFGNDIANILNTTDIKSLPDKFTTHVLYECIINKAPLISIDDHDGYYSDSNSFEVVGTNAIFNKSLQKHDINFLCHDAISIWLHLFIPLNSSSFESRNLLFPNLNVTFNNAVDDSDTVTLNTAFSFGNSPLTPGNTKKNTVIQDSSLDPEVITQTCYILSFYFIHYLLPQTSLETLHLTLDFIEKYGAYLLLLPILIHSLHISNYNTNYSSSIIQSILEHVAQFDWKHVESVKEIHKHNTRYQQYHLSALIEWLLEFSKSANKTASPLPVRRKILFQQSPTIQESSNNEVTPYIYSLLSAAYPELNPRYIHDILSDSKPDFYFQYLCTLLSKDSRFGKSTAQSNSELVMEWCRLSAKNFSKGKENLLCVYNTFESASELMGPNTSFISTNTKPKRMYNVDLLELMQILISVKELGLALLIGKEIIETQFLKPHPTAPLKHLDQVLSNLLSISQISASQVKMMNSNTLNEALNAIRQVIEIASLLSSSSCSEICSLVPSQLFEILSIAALPGQNPPSIQMDIFEQTAKLIVECAIPKDVFKCFILFLQGGGNTSAKATNSMLSTCSNKPIIDQVRKLLERDALHESKQELSLPLLFMNSREKHDRKQVETSNSGNVSNAEDRLESIWSNALKGHSIICK